MPQNLIFQGKGGGRGGVFSLKIQVQRVRAPLPGGGVRGGQGLDSSRGRCWCWRCGWGWWACSRGFWKLLWMMCLMALMMQRNPDKEAVCLGSAVGDEDAADDDDDDDGDDDADDNDDAADAHEHVNHDMGSCDGCCGCLGSCDGWCRWCWWWRRWCRRG